ncbi:MAG: 50S ribosomal protein L21e [Candidatus Altiarchaeota archaeon]|nr:50S ribosomal protein L21e [Candidatus Altiarchaeota archaeon]
MKGSSGFRRRTRGLRIKPKERGKVKIRQRMQTFKENDLASISINPSYQNIPHPRYQGRTGRIVGMQGRAYHVEIKDGGKTKKVLVTPEHLKRIA